ncbi:recQ mediated genome instability protein 1 [Trichuris trichiura]|uniref:RecQ-mediated genome instability protein 1 n=1 Tax=Trichuris trichiura TaxID=36087 RepID=A0A077Z1B9_TRITR|nr:recQ mediated genome instability protein 1 [Trichuris trichiura]
MDRSQLFAVVANRLAIDKIPFQTEWLKECLEYIHGEVNGEVLSGVVYSLIDLILESFFLADKDVFEMVYQQWLFCDLRDFGVVSLPMKLSERAVEVLNGVFYINSMLDVSRSFYSQHQNLLGSKGQKTNHLFVLELTDGFTCYRGIEYGLICELNYSVRPGAKAKIFGKVRYVKEFLLLSSENFCLLGGSCDSLESASSVASVLERKLDAVRSESAVGKSIFSSPIQKKVTVPLEKFWEPPVLNASSKADTQNPSVPSFYSSTSPVSSSHEYNSIQHSNDANYFCSTDSQNNLNEYWTEELIDQDDGELQPLMYAKVSIDAEEGLLETSQRLAVIQLRDGKNITVESNVTNGIHICFDNQLETSPVKLLAEIPTEKAGKYFIRGILLTTIGRLDPNRGRHWSLHVKMNDGSAAMDMKMSADLLTRLIGISSEKAWAIKTGTITDSVQRNLAAEVALKKCGQFLRDFDGAMEVVFTGINEMPVICRLLSVPSFEDVVP